jgi:RNA polymerase sigma-70 factor (ECF subfamily)
VVGPAGVESAVRGSAVAGSAAASAREDDAATRITVRDVVLALPDGLRLPVILHYYADLPVAVVAARLGKSEGAVKRDLFDARRRMAAQLEGVR